MRVAFVVLDGFPVRHVRAELTPTLWRLAADGGTFGVHVRSVLTSATYPNHASFVTGTTPDRHGLWTNHVVREGRVRTASEVGPDVATLFDACRAAGRRSTAIVGDRHLVGVCGLQAADDHWPPGGQLPEGTATDPLGYALDDGTLARHVGAAQTDADLLFLHLNEPDTWGHLHGPDTDGALGAYADADRRLAVLLEAFSARWDDTVVIVVSDHDMATVTGLAIDLRAPATAAGAGVHVLEEGSAAAVVGLDPTRGSWLSRIDGVACAIEVTPDLRLVFAEAGRWFASVDLPLRGVHGGLETQRQLAAVTGGHPAVRALHRALAAGLVQAEDWAPTIASLLGLDLPTATGRDLLA